MPLLHVCGGRLRPSACSAAMITYKGLSEHDMQTLARSPVPLQGDAEPCVSGGQVPALTATAPCFGWQGCVTSCSGLV